ncbi:MAG: twin-arginine translocation signal domain-containing protein [Pirellulaceae bacterium]
MSFSPLQPNPDWVRRDVLKGLSLGAGATLLAPLIQQAVALAEGKSDGVQRRVVFVLQSNGLRPSFITPSGHVWKESREGGTTGGELVELSLRDKGVVGRAGAAHSAEGSHHIASELVGPHRL